MSLSRFSVSYLDGRDPVEVAITPRVQVELERRWPDATKRPLLESIYFGMYVGTGGDPKDEAAFEAFIDSVADYDPIPLEGHSDPSPPVAGDA